MISSKITLKQLEALIRVVDLKSFRKAADHLRTTQPNVSARISGLEEALGQTLLVRDSGAVRPTGDAEPVLRAARKAVAAAEGVLEAANRADLVDTPLRLGVTEMVACTWLRPFLRALSDRYPHVSVDLTVDLSADLGKALEGHALDLAIQSAPFSGGASGDIALGTYPYVWVAAPVWASGLSAGSDLQALANRAIVTHARHTTAVRALDAELKSRRIKDARIISSSSLTLAMQMTLDGLGAGLLPKAMVAADVQANRLVVVAADWLPPPLEFAARFHADAASLLIAASAQLAAEIAASHDQENLSTSSK